MAKKQLSIYLSDDIIEKIDIYKKENKLKSRSIAIERIILEWSWMSNIMQKSVINTDTSGNNAKPKTQEELVDELLESGFDDIFSDM